jgi:hypothetical protein
MVGMERVRTLNARPQKTSGPVFYWMRRDMRVSYNWALLYAADTARELHVPLTVCFRLAPSFLGATLRAYDFLLQGLQEVERDLRRLNIPFLLLEGDPSDEVCQLVNRLRPALLVADFNPLRPITTWKTNVAGCVGVQMVEVDAVSDGLCAGDRYLLCSDGLWGTVSESDLKAGLTGGSPEETVPRLADPANTCGGPGNCMAIVVDVQETGEAAD